MQLAINTTIEAKVFSMLFAYIHCWETDVFSMDPPQDYISGTEPNQIRIDSREWGESSAVKEEGFGRRFIVSYCN
jgi:hypothetical protein